MKIKISLAILSVFFSSSLWAHALWIETNHTGTKGKKQEVRIYFGEFADKDISPAAKWFSDLKDFSLIVIGPDKSETKLSSKAATDFYVAEFTPTQNGVYTVVMHHTAKDVYYNMKLDYNSSATVVVGGQLGGNDLAFNSNNISLFADSVFAVKQNRSLKLKAVQQAKPATEKELKVFAPNGWGKELYSNDNGEISFTPLWPGKYMAEFAFADKTPGEHNGTKYEEVWNVATYIITVK